VVKALGGPVGVYLRQVEVLADGRGKPLVVLHGPARERAAGLGLRELAVSLSHSREYAIAVAAGDTKK